MTSTSTSTSNSININTNNNNNKDSDNSIIDEDDTDYRLYKKNDNNDNNYTINNNSPVVQSTNSKTKETAREVLSKLSMYDILVPPLPFLFPTSKNKKLSWILVIDGSLGGFFDWVPQYLRVGPWKVLAILYFTCIVVATIGTGIYLLFFNTSTSDSDSNSNNKRYSIEHLIYIQQYYYSQYNTIGWYYNILGSLWMIYIIYCIVYKSPVGIGAWTTYTVQSWSILCIRHILCCLIPFCTSLSSIKTIVYICEIIKFSCCISTSITFIIWNFFICPYVYYVILQTPIEKLNFYKFCTSFRLLNIHGLNIVLLFCNIYFSSKYNGNNTINIPLVDNTKINSNMMELQWISDFYISIVSMVLYMSVYLLIYDRLGIHLYPIFSPRSYIFVLSWTGSLLLYIGLFIIWRSILQTISIRVQ